MLANLNLNAATNTALYTCSSPTRMVGELSICNTAPGNTTIRVAIVTGGGSPSAANWIEYDRVVGGSGVTGNGPLTRSIILKPTQVLWVYSLNAGTTAILSGIEE